MASFNYSPLTYQSFGFQGLQPFLQGYGQNYGYLGKYDYNYPNQYSGAYRVGDYLFNNQQGYNDLNALLSGRAGFLDQQLQSNPTAYQEYAANPYAFTGSTPFKSAAQKAAEAEAAKQAAALAQQGGTVTNTTTTQTAPTGKTAKPQQTVSIANLAPLPVPTQDQLPDYIPPNNNALLRELRKLLGNIPQIFSTKGISNAFQKRADIDEAFGSQAASNAAAEFANRTRAEGGDASLAGLVRAQALLPVLQQNAALQADLRDKKLQNRQARGTLSANVAEALASLRTNYLKGLIDYTGKIQDIQSTNQLSTQRLNEQQREFDIGNKLDLSRLALQERQQNQSDKQNQLQILLALANLSKQRIDPRVRGSVTNTNPFGTVDPYRQEQNDSLESLLAQIQGLI